MGEREHAPSQTKDVKHARSGAALKRGQAITSCFAYYGRVMGSPLIGSGQRLTRPDLPLDAAQLATGWTKECTRKVRSFSLDPAVPCARSATGDAEAFGLTYPYAFNKPLRPKRSL